VSDVDSCYATAARCSTACYSYSSLLLFPLLLLLLLPLLPGVHPDVMPAKRVQHGANAAAAAAQHMMLSLTLLQLSVV
jgi:hypothetical protein